MPSEVGKMITVDRDLVRDTPTILKAIGYATGTSITGSLSVLLVARCIFGFRLAEWQGGIVGVVGTIAGVAGAVIGLQIALRPERRASK